MLSGVILSDCIIVGKGFILQKMCSNVMKSIEEEIAGLDPVIDKIVAAAPEIKHKVNIMTSMTGIGQAAAVTLLSKSGSLKECTARQFV